MTSYRRAVSAEWLKLSKSKLWPQIFLCAILVMLLGILNGKPEELAPWEYLISIMIILHAMLLLPILTGILVPWCVGMSIRAGDEAVLVLPVSRGAVYFAKFSVVAMLLAVVSYCSWEPCWGRFDPQGGCSDSVGNLGALPAWRLGCLPAAGRAAA